MDAGSGSTQAAKAGPKAKALLVSQEAAVAIPGWHKLGAMLSLCMRQGVKVGLVQSCLLLKYRLCSSGKNGDALQVLLGEHRLDPPHKLRAAGTLCSYAACE